MQENKEGESRIVAILKALQGSSYITPSIIDPLLAIGQEAKDNKYLERFSNSILLKLTSDLISKIDTLSEEQIDDIFMKLVDFIDPINHPDLNRIFDKIVSKSSNQDIIMAIHAMSPHDILKVFKNTSRNKIFTDKEIFEKCLVYIIEPLYNDPIPLDSLINYPNVHVYFNDKFQVVHKRAVGNYAKQVIDLCCENLILYQDACKIIENIWLHTRNPLFAALRLELSQEAEKAGKYRDPYGKKYCTPLYMFLDSFTNLPNIDIDEMQILAHDPMAKSLIVNRFVLHISAFFDKNKLVYPYGDREYNGYMHYLVPGASEEQLEDLFNYLIALSIASAQGIATGQIISKIMETLNDIETDQAKEPNIAKGVAANAAHAILCICSKFIERNQQPFMKLLEQIANSKYVEFGDITTAYILLTHMLSLEVIDCLIPLIINWSRENPLISVYLILFFDELGKTQFQTAKTGLQNFLKSINYRVKILPSVAQKACEKLIPLYELSLSDSENSDEDSY